METMRVNAFLMFLVLITYSCNLNDKNYKYIEIAEVERLSGGKEINELEPIIIEAASDSIAYLEVK
jgi:hypothetical protein